MDEVTRTLSAIDQGDSHAAAQLLPLVYDELRRLATHRLAREKPRQTLDATALVHEAYPRLVESDRRDSSPPRENGRHFFAAAAAAMRRILVENARRKQAPKYGGGRQRRVLETDALISPTPNLDLLALDSDCIVWRS
jgi:RNA polymerase sigma factor (TIGR02999 family)